MATLKQVIDSTAALRGKTYPEIAAYLAECPSVANPDAGKTTPVAVPVTLKQILALVPPAEGAKVFALSGYVDKVQSAIDLNDHEYLLYLLSVAVAAGAISAGTATKLGALLKTEDVAAPAQIPGPARWQTAGLAAAPTASDVQAAMHSGG